MTNNNRHTCLCLLFCFVLLCFLFSDIIVFASCLVICFVCLFFFFSILFLFFHFFLCVLFKVAISMLLLLLSPCTLWIVQQACNCQRFYSVTLRRAVWYVHLCLLVFFFFEFGCYYFCVLSHAFFFSLSNLDISSWFCRNPCCVWFCKKLRRWFIFIKIKGPTFACQC